MARRISDIVPLLFITLLCVGFVEGGYLALEYFLMKDQTEKKSAVQQSVAEPVQRPKVAQKKHDYRIILERNIFGAPPAGNAAETVVNVPAKDLEETTLKIALKGTIHGVEESDRAIILDQKSRTQQLYQKGDGIQGAFVKEILRGRVILSHNGNDETLDMSDTAGSAEVAGRPVAVAPRRIRKKASSRVAPRVQNRPARRVRKPRIIRPLKPVAGASKS
jgi:type II secretory pathway component PulC